MTKAAGLAGDETLKPIYAQGSQEIGRILGSTAFRLAKALGKKPVVALVGAGGKTSALYATAAWAAEERCRVCITTTTHIRDPRTEDGRVLGVVMVDPRLGEPPPSSPGTTLDSVLLQATATGLPVVVAAAQTKLAAVSSWGGGSPPGRIVKLRGLDPLWIGPLIERFDMVVVEADGAAMRPIKAPAGHEPVIPPETTVVVGVIGLSCLGKPMNGTTVHRPELFGPLTDCRAEEPIRVEHLRKLVLAEEGLFKGYPPSSGRLLLLNQADTLTPESLEEVTRVFLPHNVEYGVIGTMFI